MIQYGFLWIMDVLAFFSWANGMKNEEGINAGVMKGRPNDICGGWVASLVEGPGA